MKTRMFLRRNRCARRHGKTSAGLPVARHLARRETCAAGMLRAARQPCQKRCCSAPLLYNSPLFSLVPAEPPPCPSFPTCPRSRPR
ncbi:hypothetical protein BTO02_01315 [Paraburkholderia sp. SOS3]|nr:hypothetical protein BTO02_01315 [Paraburkholderia sp. SOS3]